MAGFCSRVLKRRAGAPQSPTMAAELDWQTLLHQSEDLVAQDYHEFPRVNRNIDQLQQYADGLRSRTSKFRTVPDQHAATRLLAQQGFDAARLTQDVAMLEVHPTVEDVFDADTTSVEEYLRQVEESTILSAIQEAQQDTVSSFDSYMEDCMLRDWAANKRHLFGLIAPHTGILTSFGPARASSLGPASGVLIGAATRQAGGTLALPSAPFTPVIQGGRLPAKEAAYSEAMLRYSQAAAARQPLPDIVREFAAACKANEDKSAEAPMSGCWSLLADILGQAKANGVPPQPVGRFTEALLQGARRSLEGGHTQHMRLTIHRHKVQAERGPDPDPLREVQAYILLRAGPSRGPLDFQQPGGHDSSWLQVYYSLRNGWHDAARRAADRAQDVVAARLGDVGFRALLDEWLRNGKLSERTSAVLMRDVDRLLRDKASLKSQLRQPYLVLLCALMAGYAHAIDALVGTDGMHTAVHGIETAALSQLQVASVLTTLEDFMWAKLTVVSTGGSLGVSPSSPDVYTLERLQADLSRWPASYYSKQGKEPLLYITVLLLSLQFQAALKFLWKDETTRAYRADAVHLAIALHTDGALKLPSSEPGPDVGSMLHAYGRKFVHSNSHVALAYYMLAASVKGGSLAVKGQMLRELLTESRDFGSLLGGGGAAGSGGPLAAYVPDIEDRKRLFEAVAYECQVAAQLSEAVELYMAADRPRQALAILSGQLSATLLRAVEEQAAGATNGTTAARDAAARLLSRGRDARQAITSAVGSGGPAAGRTAGLDAGGRVEVEAFDQLCAIYDLLLAARKGRHDMALQKLAELPFIPLEHARVDACVRAAASLQPAVQERLPDILTAAADAISAAARSGRAAVGSGRSSQRVLRDQLDALLTFANSVSYRLSKGVYQRLCETAASFS